MTTKPESADVQVGLNIRRLRVQKGLSQSNLADAIGVTFQQVQKYEKGTNRVSASRLIQIAAFVDVKVDALFAGIEGADDGASPPAPMMTREAYLLASDFESISDASIRHSIRGLVKSLGRQQTADAA